MYTQNKKILIITDIGKKEGLGHYSRAKILNSEIQFYFSKKYKIFNILFTKHKIKNNYTKFSFSFQDVLNKIKKINPNIIIINTSKIFEKNYGSKLINFSKKFNRNINLICIDGFLRFNTQINSIWIPNIIIPKKYQNKNVFFGWDKLILQRKINFKKKNFTKNFLISHGGSDVYNLTKKLPKYLFNLNLNINWIIGPYARKPKINKKYKNIHLIHQPKTLGKFIRESYLAFTLFGMSFFETIYHSVPTIVMIPRGKENRILINYIKKEKILVLADLKKLNYSINKIINNYNSYKKKIERVSNKINFSKRKKFYQKILK